MRDIDLEALYDLEANMISDIKANRERDIEIESLKAEIELYKGRLESLSDEAEQELDKRDIRDIDLAIRLLADINDRFYIADNELKDIYERLLAYKYQGLAEI